MVDDTVDTGVDNVIGMIVESSGTGMVVIGSDVLTLVTFDTGTEVVVGSDVLTLVTFETETEVLVRSDVLTLVTFNIGQTTGR